MEIDEDDSSPDQPQQLQQPQQPQQHQQKRPCRTDEQSASVPEVPDEGFLVKTLFAAILPQTCGGLIKHGASLSNEICGKVLSVGSKVPAECGIKVGDVVIVYPWQGCRQCEICSSGSSHLCEEKTDVNQENGGKENSKSSTSTHGDDLNSSSGMSNGLASFQLVHEWPNAVRLPREIPGEIGCMLTSSALKVYAAILEARPFFEQAVRIRGFSNLLVIGGGGSFELLCIHLMKSIFCDRNVKVICTDRNPTAIRLASEAGADDAVLLKEGATVHEMAVGATMNGYNKMDVVIDAVGDATSFAVALASLHHGGVVLVLQDGDPDLVQLPLSLLVSKSITIRAIGGGSRRMLKQLVDLVAVQGLSSSVLPVENFKPDEVSVALDRLHKGEIVGRAVIRYE